MESTERRGVTEDDREECQLKNQIVRLLRRLVILQT